MAKKSQLPENGVLAFIALLVGGAALYFAFWGALFLVIASLVFVGLTAFADLAIDERIGYSCLAAFISLKLLGLIEGVVDCLPESWVKKTKPCPACGKRLKTELAKQCLHCGADWH